MIRRTGIIDAGSHTISYTKALLNLAQQQNAAVRGEQTAIETGIYPLARNPREISALSLRVAACRSLRAAGDSYIADWRGRCFRS